MINWEEIYKTLLIKRGLKQKSENIYTELHHIVPRYLGGGNERENLIRLSLKDHTLAHYVLWRWKGNLQDRVAYLMKGGQTERGNIERVRLAAEASREINKKRWLLCNPMKDKKIVTKAKQIRLQKYNGNFHSKEGLQSIKDYNTGKQISSQVIQKIQKTLKETRTNMSDQEYYEKYIKTQQGKNNPNYGKKRPGELAGNYGTNKGTYILITPQGERIEFKGITKLIKYGVGETIIRNWRNRGVIIPQPNNNRSPWIGYQIEFKPNPKYGQVRRQIQKTKRDINL
jgi:hypothetical protein